MMNDRDMKALYDSFQVKDMPFAEFRRELIDATDPAKAQADLAGIMRARANGRAIDAAIRRN